MDMRNFGLVVTMIFLLWSSQLYSEEIDNSCHMVLETFRLYKFDLAEKPSEDLVKYFSPDFITSETELLMQSSRIINPSYALDKLVERLSFGRHINLVYDYETHSDEGCELIITNSNTIGGRIVKNIIAYEYDFEDSIYLIAHITSDYRELSEYNQERVVIENFLE